MCIVSPTWKNVTIADIDFTAPATKGDIRKQFKQIHFWTKVCADTVAFRRSIGYFNPRVI